VIRLYLFFRFFGFISFDDPFAAMTAFLCSRTDFAFTEWANHLRLSSVPGPSSYLMGLNVP
jgi:hypothetical protein